MRKFKNIAIFFAAFAFVLSLKAASGDKPKENTKTQNLPASELKYTPRPELKGDIEGILELFYSYEVIKTGKIDPVLKEPDDEVYKITTAKDGERLSRKRIYALREMPEDYRAKEVITLMKVGDERWAIKDFYDMKGALTNKIEYCFASDLDEELRSELQKGDVKALYKKTDGFNKGLPIYIDANFFDYDDTGAIKRKEYRSVRSGALEDRCEDFTDGRISAEYFLEGTKLLWMKLYHPNGMLKAFIDYENDAERRYDENGKLVSESKI